MVIKGGKFMPAYSSSRTHHSMISLVSNNRTGELYRRGKILSGAVYRISRPQKRPHYSFSLSGGRAEDEKRENIEET